MEWSPVGGRGNSSCKKAQPIFWKLAKSHLWNSTWIVDVPNWAKLIQEWTSQWRCCNHSVGATAHNRAPDVSEVNNTAFPEKLTTALSFCWRLLLNLGGFFLLELKNYMDSWEDTSWKPIQKCILPFVFPPFKRDTHKHPREPALLLRTVLWDLKSAFPWFSAQTFCAAAAHPRDPWVVSFCSFTPESASAARIDPASPQSLLFPLSWHFYPSANCRAHL